MIKGILKRFATGKNFGFNTLAIHAGQSPDAHSGAVITPITMSSTFCQVTPGQNYPADCMYTRIRNPTRTALEDNLKVLEGAKHGFVYGSGMGAITNITSLFDEGDHILAIDDIYGGTFELFEDIYSTKGLEFTFTDMNRDDLEDLFQENTKCVWLESPTNPLLKVTDIEKVSELAHKNGALVVVDNTFMSPYLQNPLDLGADIVFHSCTKYINGHADVVLGFACTNDDDIAEKMFFLNKTLGASASPFDSWLVLRGVKTLGIRMEKAQENTVAIAEMLDNHPYVDHVIFPGLKSHEQHDIATKQARGYGAMITIYLKGDLEESAIFLESLKVFALAVSLGGVESLAEHPALMTHQGIPLEIREEGGIMNNLVRLSIGIEDAEDLIWDLDQALNAMYE